jgi:hypothetical protein
VQVFFHAGATQSGTRGRHSAAPLSGAVPKQRPHPTSLLFDSDTAPVNGGVLVCMHPCMRFIIFITFYYNFFVHLQDPFFPNLGWGAHGKVADIRQVCRIDAPVPRLHLQLGAQRVHRAKPAYRKNARVRVGFGFFLYYFILFFFVIKLQRRTW